MINFAAMNKGGAVGEAKVEIKEAQITGTVATAPVHPALAEAAQAFEATQVDRKQAEDEKKTEGQRFINAKWEATQQIIAVSVTIVTLLVCGYLVMYGKENIAVPAFLLLSNVFFLVVGTYFQRTNHTKTGGPGGTDSR